MVDFEPRVKLLFGCPLLELAFILVLILIDLPFELSLDLDGVGGGEDEGVDLDQADNIFVFEHLVSFSVCDI